MQKQAWINSMAAMVLGACCLMLRWLQNINIFEEETGLAAAGSALSTMLGAALALSVAILWVLSRFLRRYRAPLDPGAAFGAPPRILVGVLGIAAMAAAVGAIGLYFLGTNLLLKLTALFALLAVPTLMLYPLLSRWGLLGALLSLNPILFFSFWLVVSYREYAVNPVVWSYALLILSVAALLLAAYRLAGYIHYRARPEKTVFACGTAALFCLASLMDTQLGLARAILGAWAVGLLALCWLLVYNMQPPAESADAEEGVYG